MEVSFEYIVAGLAMLLVLASTQAFMYALTIQKLTSFEKESEYSLADEILDILLLSPGFPSDWGRSLEKPYSLGLAESNDISGYALDPYKVARLIPGSPGFIPPPEARRLLGLTASTHFSLRIKPFFSIEVIEDNGLIITVRNCMGLSVPNANVTVFLVPDSITPGLEYPSQSKTTDLNGVCYIDFSIPPGFIAVILVEQFGARSIANFPICHQTLVEGGRVYRSDAPLITGLEYSTGYITGIGKQSASRFVEIFGLTYIAEFDLWG